MWLWVGVWHLFDDAPPSYYPHMHYFTERTSSRTVETCLRYFRRLWKRWWLDNPISQPRKISTITPGTGSVCDPVWASMLKPGCTDTCCQGVFTPGVSGKTQTGISLVHSSWWRHRYQKNNVNNKVGQDVKVIIRSEPTNQQQRPTQSLLVVLLFFVVILYYFDIILCYFYVILCWFMLFLCYSIIF